MAKKNKKTPPTAQTDSDFPLEGAASKERYSGFGEVIKHLHFLGYEISHLSEAEDIYVGSHSRLGKILFIQNKFGIHFSARWSFDHVDGEFSEFFYTLINRFNKNSHLSRLYFEEGEKTLHVRASYLGNYSRDGFFHFMDLFQIDSNSLIVGDRHLVGWLSDKEKNRIHPIN